MDPIIADAQATPPEPAAYVMSIRSGVWSLSRYGEVLMRSRDEAKVGRKLAALAFQEAEEYSRRVVGRKTLADGTWVETDWSPIPDSEGGGSC